MSSRGQAINERAVAGGMLGLLSVAGCMLASSCIPYSYHFTGPVDGVQGPRTVLLGQPAVFRVIAHSSDEWVRPQATIDEDRYEIRIEALLRRSGTWSVLPMPGDTMTTGGEREVTFIPVATGGYTVIAVGSNPSMLPGGGGFVASQTLEVLAPDAAATHAPGTAQEASNGSN